MQHTIERNINHNINFIVYHSYMWNYKIKKVHTSSIIATFSFSFQKKYVLTYVHTCEIHSIIFLSYISDTKYVITIHVLKFINLDFRLLIIFGFLLCIKYTFVYIVYIYEYKITYILHTHMLTILESCLNLLNLTPKRY